MPLMIPTFPDEPNYTIASTLDGTTYALRFWFSARESCSYVDLALNDGTSLVAGKKIVCGISLWRRYRYNTLVPQGDLVCLSSVSESDGPPTLGELGIGRRCTLIYVSAAELAAGGS